MDRALLLKPPRDLIRLFFEASSEGFQREVVVCSIIWNSTDVGDFTAKRTEHLLHDGILLRFFSQPALLLLLNVLFRKRPLIVLGFHYDAHTSFTTTHVQASFANHLHVLCFRERIAQVASVWRKLYIQLVAFDGSHSGSL